MATWSPRISRTNYGWSVDWWERGHKQRRFRSVGDAEAFAGELKADRAAREAAEKKQRAIQRANIRRGDVVVDLLRLPPGEKVAVAEALEVLRKEGGGALDLPAAAREWAARHLAESRATLEDVLARHLEDLAGLGRSARTIEQRRNLCGKFVAAAGASRRAGSVARWEIAEWVAQAPTGSRRSWYTAVAALFRWAWQRGYVPEYPMGQLPKPQAARHGEAAILKPDEVRLLLDAAVEVAPEMVNYIALGVFAGLRPMSELGHLDWKDIDLEEGKIFTVSKKTGRARPVPISPNLAAWLERTPEKARHGLAAPFSRRAWWRVQEKAGVDVGHDVLRHTRVSYRLALVGDPGVVAAEGGHTLSILQRHYANLRLKQAEVEAFWGIRPGLDT